MPDFLPWMVGDKWCGKVCEVVKLFSDDMDLPVPHFSFSI